MRVCTSPPVHLWPRTTRLWRHFCGSRQRAATHQSPACAAHMAALLHLPVSRAAHLHVTRHPVLGLHMERARLHHLRGVAERLVPPRTAARWPQVGARVEDGRDVGLEDLLRALTLVLNARPDQQAAARRVRKGVRRGRGLRGRGQSGDLGNALTRHQGGSRGKGGRGGGLTRSSSGGGSSWACTGRGRGGVAPVAHGLGAFPPRAHLPLGGLPCHEAVRASWEKVDVSGPRGVLR
jgi:uncharacterized membrane protein YgcG